jgi:hypothetical protein
MPPAPSNAKAARFAPMDCILVQAAAVPELTSRGRLG